MWASIQKEQQDIGTLLERFWVYCFCCVLFCLVGGFCCVFLYLVMDVLGIVISLLRRMFQLLLVIPFGRFCVIIRCLGWCLLDKWIERSRGLVKDLCYKGFDLLCLIGPSCSRWVSIWTCVCVCVSVCFSNLYRVVSHVLVIGLIGYGWFCWYMLIIEWN